jgi:hypothetical protein
VAAEDDEQLQEVEQKRATASDAIVNSDSAEKIRLVRIALENAAAHEPPPGVPTLEEVFAAGIEPASGVPIRQPGAGLEISERLGTGLRHAEENSCRCARTPAGSASSASRSHLHELLLVQDEDAAAHGQILRRLATLTNEEKVAASAALYEWRHSRGRPETVETLYLLLAPRPEAHDLPFRQGRSC